MLVREIGITTVVNWINLLFAIALSIVLARFLGPEGKGQLAVLLLTMSAMGSWGSLGIGFSSTYQVAHSSPSSRAKVASNAINVSIVLALTYGLLMGLGVLLLADRVLIVWAPVESWVVASFLVPFSLVSGCLRGVLLGLNRLLEFNAVVLGLGALHLSLVVILVGFMKMGVPGALVASIGVEISAVLAYCWRIRSHINVFPTLNLDLTSRLMRYGVKGYIGNAVQFLNYRVDTFIVAFFVGPTATGLYMTAVGLAEIIWRLPMAVGTVLFPKVPQMHPVDASYLTARLVRIVLTVTTISAVVLGVVAPLFLPMLYGHAFSPAVQPLLIMLPGVALLSANKVLGNYFSGRGRPLLNTIIATITLAMIVPLDLLLIPAFGIPGAAAATAFAYGASAVISVLLFTKRSGRTARETLLIKREDLETFFQFLGTMRKGPAKTKPFGKQGLRPPSIGQDH